MKVFRFMSKKEFERFNNGETLYNYKQHDENKTTSTGFCFFDLKDYNPCEAIHFLSGIVNFDVCAVFETDKSNLKERYGRYNKQNTMLIPCLFPQVFYATEYCTTKYSNKDFKLIKYSENIWKQWRLSEEQEDLKWEEINEKSND